MAAFQTIVYLDISTPQGAFVGGLEAFIAPPPDIGPFIQGQAVTFHIHPVRPIQPTESEPNPGYEHVSLSGLEFEMVIGPRIGPTAVLASLDGPGNWTATSGTYWVGTVDLNTAAMNTAIGILDKIDTFLEFRIAQDGITFKPVAQISVTVVSSVRDPGSASTPSSPDPGFMTLAQGRALFVQWNNMLDANNFGRSVILASASGLRGRGLGVDDDGSPSDFSI